MFGGILAAIMAIVAIVAIATASDYERFYNAVRPLSLQEMKKRGNEAVLKNHPDSAMNYYSLVQAAYRPDMSDDDKKEVCGAYNNAGYVYLYIYNDYPQAYTYLLRAQELAEEISYHHCLGQTYLNLGNIYANYGDEQSSVELYKKAIRESLIDDDQANYLLSLTNLMTQSFLSTHKNVNESLKTELARLDTLELQDQPLLISTRAMAKGIKLYSLGAVDDAVASFRLAYDKVDNPLTPERFQMNILGMILSIYEDANRLSDAEKIGLDAIDFAHRNKMEDLEGIALGNLSAIYHKMGRKDLATEYRLKSLEISDSLFNISTYGTIRDLQAGRDARVSAEQMQILEQKRRFQLTISWIVGIAGAICLALLIWLRIKSRKLRESYEEIYRHVSSSLHTPEKGPISLDINNISPETKTEETTEVKESIPDEHTEDGGTPVKYKDSPLHKEEMEQMRDRIVDFFENDKEIFKPDFSLDRLCAALDLKTKYASRTINELLGRSFTSLLAHYRIREACRWLEDPEKSSRLTLEAVALELGFKSRSHFAVVFKKEVGITPGEYAKISRRMKTAKT